MLTRKDFRAAVAILAHVQDAADFERAVQTQGEIFARSNPRFLWGRFREAAENARDAHRATKGGAKCAR